MIRQSTFSNNKRRSGISLLEVVVCTALVAVMVVPIAGVLRASAQSISLADGSPSKEADLRRDLRWLGTTIRSSDVTRVRNRQLQLLLSSGDTATVRVNRGTLWLDDGTNQTAIANDIRDILFSELNQSGPPGARIGITMTLRAIDPATRSLVSITSTVAIPPQI